jgi:TRAP-type C4-dicarboxylate transport system permease small subunit
MSWFKTVQLKGDRVSEKLLTISGIVCIALPIIMLIVVGVRAVAAKGVPIWSLDVSELLMWSVTYLGLGLVWRMGRHVKVEVLIDRIQGKLKRVIDFANLIIILMLSIILVWAGFRACLKSWIEQRTTEGEFPEYIFSIVIPIGLVFLLYEVLVSLVEKIRQIRS